MALKFDNYTGPFRYGLKEYDKAPKGSFKCTANGKVFLVIKESSDEYVGYIKNLANVGNKYIKAFTDLIVSTLMMKTEYINGIYFITENNNYQKHSNAKQEAIHNQELNFLRYDFVYDTLNDTNKNYINSNIQMLYSKNIINSSPLSIGR